jgi:hypothetical protein
MNWLNFFKKTLHSCYLEIWSWLLAMHENNSYWTTHHYVTSRKVVGLIPHKVIGFFNWPNPSSSAMALGSTQPLTEMSTSNLPEDKGWRASA